MVTPQQTQVNQYAGPHAESTYMYSVSTAPQLAISTASGGIQIRRGDAGKIVVVVNRRARTKAQLLALQPRVAQQKNAVTASATLPASCATDCGSVDFVVTVPQDTNIVANSDNGEIRINDVDGSVTASTKLGDILCGGLGGNVTFGSTSGRLNAGFADLTHVTKITLGTGSGSVRVVLPHNTTIGTVKLDTASGRIYAPWALNYVSKGNGVRADQQLSPSGPEIVMGTTSGDINIVLEP